MLPNPFDPPPVALRVVGRAVLGGPRQPAAHAVLRVRGYGFTDEGMTEDIVTYLRWSGCTPQSVERTRRKIGAWIRQLRLQGVESVPHLANSARWSAEDEIASNWVSLLLLQAAPKRRRNESMAHALRDMVLPRRHSLR